MSFAPAPRLPHPWFQQVQELLEVCRQPVPLAIHWQTAGWVLGSLVLIALVTPNAFDNGDSVLYLQISQGVMPLTNMTKHLGYYFLVQLHLPLVGALPLEFALNLMNNLYAAVGIGAVFLLGYLVNRHSLVGHTAAGLLLVNHLYLYNAQWAEVYMPQSALLVVAVVLWLRGWSLLCGVLFGVAALVTASTVLAGLFFVATATRLRPFLEYMGGSLLIILLFLGPFYQDFLFGGNSMVTYAGTSTFDVMPLHQKVLVEIKELYLGMFVALPLALTGMVAGWRAGGGLRVLMVALLGMAVPTLLLGQRFADVPVQLATYMILTTVAARGILELATVRWRRFGWPWWWELALPSWLMLGNLPIAFAYQYAYPADVLLFATVCGGLPLLPWLMGRLSSWPWLTTLRSGRLLALGFVLLVGAHAYRSVLNYPQSYVAYRAAMEQVAREAPAGYLLAGHFNAGQMYQHYNFGSSFRADWLDTRFEWMHTEAFDPSDVESPAGERSVEAEQLLAAVAAGRAVVVLDRYTIPRMVPLLKERGYAIREYHKWVRLALPPG